MISVDAIMELSYSIIVLTGIYKGIYWCTKRKDSLNINNLLQPAYMYSYEF
jgi:hypothetical protein